MIVLALPRNTELLSLLNYTRLFQKKEFGLDFKYFKFISPSGVSLLSSMVYSKEISLDNLDNINYLQRANFFVLHNLSLPERFKRHDATSNMLELTKIQNDNDPSSIDSKLKKILDTHLKSKETLILSILLTTYEITDNILEHSKGTEFESTQRVLDKPGFISAQYYEKDNEIQIGISDLGVGIVESMAKAYPELSREEILQKAFSLNTSRHIAIMPKRGNGLAKLVEVVLQSRGRLICITNEFQIRFDSGNKDGIISRLDTEVLGTHFEIVIGCLENIDSQKIFNAQPDDYDDLDDFFDF